MAMIFILHYSLIEIVAMYIIKEKKCQQIDLFMKHERCKGG